jgi:hypothetical protein
VIVKGFVSPHEHPQGDQDWAHLSVIDRSQGRNPARFTQVRTDSTP